ncbi:MAG: hypothetical protein IPJ65_11315 [Archangiaceae bacterium]|nr:hypothetical protein [Archangiaceae bacterium]
MRAFLLASLLTAAARASAQETVGVSLSATSMAKDAEPEKLVNLKLDRGWCEGAKGPGVREAVTVQLSRAVPVKAVVLRVASESTELPHDVPAAISIEPGAQPAVRVEMFGGRWENETRVALAGAPLDRLTVRIAGVSKPQHEETCISELVLLGPSGRYTLLPGVDETDKPQLASLLKDARAAFGSCDAGALARVLAPKFKARLIDPDAERPDVRDEVPVAEVVALCKAGRLALGVGDAPPEPSGAALTVRFAAKTETEVQAWTAKRVDGAWRLDSVESRLR